MRRLALWRPQTFQTRTKTRLVGLWRFTGRQVQFRASGSRTQFVGQITARTVVGNQLRYTLTLASGTRFVGVFR